MKKIMHFITVSIVLILVSDFFGICMAQVPVSVLTLPGDHREDGFWVSLHAARSGKVYIGTCIHGGTGHFYEYDPAVNKIRHITSSNDAILENTPLLEPHGKIHCKIVEDKKGRIWWGTDMGYHYYLQKWDAPDGYPGGHLMVYDPATDHMEDLGLTFPRASIRVLTIDENRDILYVVTFPDGRFYSYDIATNRKRFLGRVNNCDQIARLLVVDDVGNVYGSFNEYRMFKYDVEADKLMDLPVTLPHMEGPWCDKGHYHRETVWRDVTWDSREKIIYGIEHGSSVMFSFDPRTNEIRDHGQLVIPEIMGQRIIPETSHSFMWHEGLQKIVYSAPNPTQHQRRGLPRRLMTYNPKTGEKRDYGEMRDPVSGGYPIYTEGVSIGPDGTIYFCGNVRLKEEAGGEWVIGLVILKMSDVK